MMQEPEFIVRVEASPPQDDIILSRKQINLFLSGQGGGKTFIGGCVSGALISNFPNVSGFIGANTYTQLSDSTLKRIRTVWRDWGWTEWSRDNPNGEYVVDVQPPAHFNTSGHDFDTYRGKICFRLGTVIFKGSLENYKAHDGKEFGWAILDETKDTREEAVKEVIIGRLRQRGMYFDKYGEMVDSAVGETGEVHTPWNPLYILTSPAKVQWINEWFNLDEYAKEITELIYSEKTYFRKEIDNKLAVICSTYHNNHNLPSNYIENQMQNLHSARQDMLIYGNPFSSSGGEFYKCFIRTKHVMNVMNLEVDINGELKKVFNTGRPRPYCPGIPLHISFDFNVNPYITCTIWQVIGKLVVQIDEICLANPVNTTTDICKEFIRRYQGHEGGLFVYGDPSGRQQDTRSEKGHNDFVIIIRALAQFKPTQRIASAAPPVAMRGNFINTILEKGFEDMVIFIDEHCVKSISDLTYLKEASDGTKLKEKIKNPDTGVTYEKFGHTSDSMDYFICVAFGSEFARYMKGGVAGTAASTGKASRGRNSY